MRPRKGTDPVLYTTNIVIRGPAGRIKDLDDEIGTIDTALGVLIVETAASLLELYGIGVVTAGTLLVAAGDTTPKGSLRSVPGRSCVALHRSQRVQGELMAG